MLQLRQTVPDRDVLLALEPEELAAKLLFLIRNRPDLGGRYHAGNLENELWHDVPGQPSYPRGRRTEISLAVAEALAWLEAQGLAVPDTGLNGSNGWRRLSRRALNLANSADFAQYAMARRLPRESMHPKLAQTVWLAFMRRSRVFGQVPGRNKLKAGSRLLVSPVPEIKFILSCCGVL